MSCTPGKVEVTGAKEILSYRIALYTFPQWKNW
jgi:hypothetical protein